jgi:hypothetical protein
MYFKLDCKNCGKQFKVEDLDYYPETGREEEPSTRSAEWQLCGECVNREIDLRLIKLLSDILDKCENNDYLKEKIISLIEVLSGTGYDSIRLKELLETHFKGRDGMENWGLW